MSEDTAKRTAFGVLGRAGFGARALTYTVAGAISLMAALSGQGSEAKGTRESLKAIDEGELGKMLVVVLAVGLAAYALFNLIRAVWDPEDDGTDTKGWIKRIGHGISALIHGSMSVAAVQVGSGSSSAGSDGEMRMWVSRILEWPAGAVLVGAVGVGIIGYGIYEFTKAFKGEQADEWETERMPRWLRKGGVAIARVGHGARGVVFCMMGGFLVHVALETSPQDAKGLGESLREIAETPWGQVALGCVAAGLIAFGVYQLLQAIYRKVG